MLAAYAGTGPLAADPAGTDELIRACAGSVLALRIAGAKLARWPALSATDLAGLLADPDGRLDVLVHDDLSVRASVATAVAMVGCDKATMRLLTGLGGGDLPNSVPRLARRVGVSAARVCRAIENLLDAQLVEGGPADYRLAPLVDAYVAELAGSPSEPRLGTADSVPPRAGSDGTPRAGGGGPASAGPPRSSAGAGDDPPPAPGSALVAQTRARLGPGRLLDPARQPIDP
ncbi:hypothetical protein ACFFWC_23260 [Plantactinospora siamensis]|uniref:MarR family transcriptional regulator n=1 Tax=Plantactinospora siamensis TaxID=555372 RepID=A0ABV6NUC4_9ACTN